MLTQRWRPPVLVLALVLVAAMVPALAQARVVAQPLALPGDGTITLVTGDQVVLAGDGRPRRLQPAKGRESVRMMVQQSGADIYVLPTDAFAPIGEGWLDRELFNVTALTEFGYLDDSDPNIPVIVTYDDAAGRSSAAAGLQATSQLPAVSGIAGQVRKQDAAQFWSSLIGRDAGGVKKIWLDGKRAPLLDESVPQIGAPAAWEDGYTGAGVTVAVLDTGIDATHPDLIGKVVDARNFSRDPNPADVVGHGTHVASTIAGTGSAAGGRYKGVAPDATLLDGKVCGGPECTESAILAGMYWAAAEKDATVVNLSIGGPDRPGIDLLEEAVNHLTAEYGTLFVVAAGNRGNSGDGTVSSPGSADAALTVGAVDKSDRLAAFSGRGPRIGDGGLKPDITAPGVDITAALSKDAFGGGPGSRYTTLSGTSMATPHIAGAAAILASAQPKWAADQLKAALMASAEPAADLTAYQQGAGRVDAGTAVGQSVVATPSSIGVARQAWPHHDDSPVSTMVTYRNTGTEPLTLALTLTVTGPDAHPAASGMFSLSTDSVTVPAAGVAEVKVVTDTRVDGPDGFYSGRLTATSGAVLVNTPIAVDKEIESYNLTIEHLDRTGAPANSVTAQLGSLDRQWSVPLGDSAATMRLPAGSYSLSAAVYTQGEEQSELSVLAAPRIVLDADRTVVVDARTAQPFDIAPERASVQQYYGELSFVARFEHFRYVMSVPLDPGVTSAQIGATDSTPQSATIVMTQFAEPGAEGGFDGSPTVYNLAYAVRGGMFTGLVKRPRDAELAAVPASHRALATGREGWKQTYGHVADDESVRTLGFFNDMRMPMPHDRTEYYTTETVSWSSMLSQVAPDSSGGATQVSAPARFHPGGAEAQQWFTAPFGPGFTHKAWRGGRGEPDTFRQGDRFTVSVPLFCGGPTGWWGHADWAGGATRLYRNGELIGETDRPGQRSTFDVGPELATYRLETEATQSTVSELSTRVTIAWTFKSGHVDAVEALPVQAVRFTPQLDGANRAPAGQPFSIPIHIERQPDAAPDTIDRLSVQVSYDDGLTWQPAAVTGDGDSWVAEVNHPTGAGFVSLRAEAIDTAGNMVEQTIIRAYGLATD